MKTLIILFLLSVLLAPAWAQNTAACTPATIRGVYSVSCSGWISPAAGAPQVPATMSGIGKGDWTGTVVSSGVKLSLGGGQLDTAARGTSVVNSDCTGTITYQQTIAGQPGPPLNIVFHILDDGNEMRGMVVDQGATMVCNLRLMNR
jgi:hypothetical protein